MTSDLARACRMPPFANGTEGEAWQSKWCSYCAHDHGFHGEEPGDSAGCELWMEVLTDGPWPEAWLPEPDDGRFFLPSRLICAQFKPCTEGDCTGDPGATERAERVAEVTAYWAGAARREAS